MNLQNGMVIQSDNFGGSACAFVSVRNRRILLAALFAKVTELERNSLFKKFFVLL